MRAILNMAGYIKTIEVDHDKPIYTDRFVMAGQEVVLPYVKEHEEEIDGETVAFYRLIDPEKDMK